MKNITGRTLQDDQDFLKSVLDGAKGNGRSFLLKPRAAVEVAINDYRTSIINNASAPIGLKKGQPGVKAVKAKKAKAGSPAVAKIPAQPAIPDSHEYYYDLYDSRRNIIASELSDLTKRYFGRLCPYCGVDTVSHIDHYLPRSEFPEFSISLQNLLMSCDGCNSTYKGTHWGNGVHKKVFHPALDNIPSGVFLEATCSYKSKAISVGFSISHNWKGTLIERHFILMNLNDRYIPKVTFEEVPKMRNILDAQNSNLAKINDLKNFVAQQITANAPNSFLNAFYLAVQPLVNQIAIGGL